MFQVVFTHSDGTENLNPGPPFRINIPRNLKGISHALPGNGKSTADSVDVATKDIADSEKEKLIVEAYMPPDPGPYPQDQPKQNSVRFTPTQVCILSLRYCMYVCASLVFDLYILSYFNLWSIWL